MAGYMLWAATKRRFGPCPVTVRPCTEPTCCGRCGGYLGHYQPRCACNWRSEIVLPGPVIEITEITIDGDPVDAGAYHVEDWAWLVHDDDQWPTCPHEISVSYTRGHAPPPGAGIVAGTLACELAKAYCNDESCAIPSNVTSMARQGITVTFDQAIPFVPSVNIWVNMVNQQSKPGHVWSPDMPSVRQITWPVTSP